MARPSRRTWGAEFHLPWDTLTIALDRAQKAVLYAFLLMCGRRLRRHRKNWDTSLARWPGMPDNGA